MSHAEGSPGPNRNFPDALEIDRMAAVLALSGTIFVDDGLEGIERERDLALRDKSASDQIFRANHQAMREPRESRVRFPQPHPVTGLDIVSQAYTSLISEEIETGQAALEARRRGDNLGAEITSFLGEQVSVPRVTLFYSYKHLRRNGR